MTDSWLDYLSSVSYDDEEDRKELDGRVFREIRRRRGLARAAAAQPRRCPRCGTTKTVADFGADASTPDGLKVWCRACR